MDFTSYHHEPPRHQPSDDFAHFFILGRSIIEGDAKWDGDLRFTEEFRYTKGYWDGLRVCLADVETDCAISKYVMLFMLRCLPTITIPISSKRFAKRVVPSTLELTGVDEKRERFIPRSSKYLLYAYHLLQSADDNRCSRASIDKWVKFWSKKTTKYHPLPPRKEKKMARPESTHNPLGDIAIHERWSTAEETLFAKLCIERSLKEEVYLAAYLTCWLCVFILPDKDVNSIRPSTFKMASLMANGKRENLAIPILASIYEGLNTVATSPKPADGSFKFVDDGHAEELDHSYFVAICSSYLTLRQGGKFIIEPYSPHRFRRQFRPKSIKITLKRKKNEDKQVDGGENDPPHALIPPVVIECDSQAAIAEASKGKGNLSLIDQSLWPKTFRAKPSQDRPLGVGFIAAKLMRNPTPRVNLSIRGHFIVILKLHSISVPIQLAFGHPFQQTSHSSTTTPPLGMELRRKQSSRPAAVSVFKISNTPVGFRSSIEDDVYLILESMKSFEKFDISKVEESLNTFFAKVRAYDDARSLSSKKLSRSLHEQQLKEAKARLQDVQAKASEEASEIQSVVDELEHIEKDIVVLKGRTTSLHATLKGKKQLNHDTQAKVHAVKRDIAVLESTCPLDDAIVENLESSRASLGILKEDLRSLNPFS
ncbi:hypothetical protein Sango_1164300 [Sesamum angolense]|uniref:Aminotransferase-like plant mobile domain-containing protein n=1 Tax=Sesamum angolense TaxID=2727404 RepID=A0AAE1WVY6_9LAMI|nr:hypothetical protein Sango_1164300 [Sesamum angolense]